MRGGGWVKRTARKKRKCKLWPLPLTCCHSVISDRFVIAQALVTAYKVDCLLQNKKRYKLAGKLCSELWSSEALISMKAMLNFLEGKKLLCKAEADEAAFRTTSSALNMTESAARSVLSCFLSVSLLLHLFSHPLVMCLFRPFLINRHRLCLQRELSAVVDLSKFFSFQPARQNSVFVLLSTVSKKNQPWMFFGFICPLITSSSSGHVNTQHSVHVYSCPFIPAAAIRESPMLALCRAHHHHHRQHSAHRIA